MPGPAMTVRPGLRWQVALLATSKAWWRVASRLRTCSDLRRGTKPLLGLPPMAPRGYLSSLLYVPPLLLRLRGIS